MVIIYCLDGTCQDGKRVKRCENFGYYNIWLIWTWHKVNQKTFQSVLIHLYVDMLWIIWVMSRISIRVNGLLSMKNRVILRVFQRIYLIELANNVSKERQYKSLFDIQWERFLEMHAELLEKSIIDVLILIKVPLKKATREIFLFLGTKMVN